MPRPCLSPEPQLDGRNRRHCRWFLQNTTRIVASQACGVPATLKDLGTRATLEASRSRLACSSRSQSRRRRRSRPNRRSKGSLSRASACSKSHIEEFLRRNISLLFEGDSDGGETLLIVGQQVVNAKGGKNDLVAIDGEGNLVLIEIKHDASDMAARAESLEFQAVRYAASLATIGNVDVLVDRVYARYVKKWAAEFGLGELTPEEMARRKIDEFLKANGAMNSFNERQRIVLVSSSFDERTLSAVAWMKANGIDISCVSLNPVRSAGQTFLRAEMLIPARKIEDYYIPIRDGASGSVVTRGPQRLQARTALPRMPKLMEWGIIQKDMELTIKNHEDSTAFVQDAKTVRFKDEEMSFNEWGQKVTGWSAICIYDWATTKEGKTLSELRAQRMEEEEEEAAKITEGSGAPS